MADSEHIYLDNAATTRVRHEVLEAMLPYLQSEFGNPSSLHRLAQSARGALEDARRKVAKTISARRMEITFTSGGTEADNAAIKGGAFALREHGNHIVTTAYEHHAVLHSANQLERLGWDVSYVNPDKNGQIKALDVLSAMRKDTVLVSVMMVNNEVGALNPIAEICGAVKQKAKAQNSLLSFHTDAIQAFGKERIDVDELGVDMVSLSGHKINAPKGVGVLYVRRGTPIEPLLAGGAQENQKRAGTENIPAIVGMGRACELAIEDMEKNHTRLKKLKKMLADGILENFPFATINGTLEDSVPSILNVSFKGFASEAVLVALDMQDIAVSSGSACSSAFSDPSHVLTSMGLDAEEALSSVRFSFDMHTKESDIKYAIGRLKVAFSKFSAMAERVV